MSGLLIMLVLMAIGFLLVPVFIYIFPFLVLAGLVVWAIQYFKTRKAVKEFEKSGGRIKRNPEAIDVEYIEYEPEQEKLP